MSISSVCVSASTTIDVRVLDVLEQPEFLGDPELVLWWRLRFGAVWVWAVCVMDSGLFEAFNWVYRGAFTGCYKKDRF